MRSFSQVELNGFPKNGNEENCFLRRIARTDPAFLSEEVTLTRVKKLSRSGKRKDKNPQESTSNEVFDF